MDQATIDQLKEKLAEEKISLEEQLSRIATKDKNLKDDYDAKFKNTGDEIMDVSNEASEVAEYQENLSIEGNLEMQLRDVNKSLESIAAGTYGKCSECGAEISEDRLMALPHAQTCMSCGNKE